MSWIITKGGGWYVRAPWSEKCYTRSKDKALRYPTEEAARADKCGNETIIKVCDC